MLQLSCTANCCLCCILLGQAVLCCAVLCCAVLCCAVLCCAALCRAVPCCAGLVLHPVQATFCCICSCCMGPCFLLMYTLLMHTPKTPCSCYHRHNPANCTKPFCGCFISCGQPALYCLQPFPYVCKAFCPAASSKSPSWEQTCSASSSGTARKVPHLHTCFASPLL